jgi:hypothetical protein
MFVERPTGGKGAEMFKDAKGIIKEGGSYS